MREKVLEHLDMTIYKEHSNNANYEVGLITTADEYDLFYITERPVVKNGDINIETELYMDLNNTQDALRSVIIQANAGETIAILDDDLYEYLEGEWDDIALELDLYME